MTKENDGFYGTVAEAMAWAEGYKAASAELIELHGNVAWGIFKALNPKDFPANSEGLKRFFNVWTPLCEEAISECRHGVKPSTR